MADPRGQIEALLGQADDRDKNVRNRVARELARFADPEYRVAITQATRSDAWRRRFAAARAMWTWPDEERLPASDLHALLNDPVASVRWAAVRATARRDRLAAVGPLATHDPTPTVRRMATASLREIPEAVEILLTCLNDPDPRVRLAAVHLLRACRATEAFDSLVVALEDRFLWIRASAVWALAEVAGAEAVPVIIPRLRDRKGFVRAAAARTLGKLGDQRAVEPIVDMLERSTSRSMKSAAIAALGSLGDKRAVTPIIEALRAAWDEDPHHFRDRAGVDTWYVRRDATKALLRLGGSEAEREIGRLPGDWVAWVDETDLP